MTSVAVTLDGDTVVSNTSWVTFEFQNNGEHSLLQIVTSDSGCVDSLVSTFPLRNSPVGSFVTDTVCFGYPVTAMANSDTIGVGPTLFEWRDGQGNYLGGFPELSIATGEGTEYPQGGQYGLDLMVHTADLFCADTTFGSFTLKEPPAIQVFCRLDGDEVDGVHGLPHDWSECGTSCANGTDSCLRPVRPHRLGVALDP